MMPSVFLVCLLLPTQTPPVVDVKTAEFELHFADDTTVRGTVADGTIVVRTAYGSLKVPLKDIRRLNLGFRFPDGVDAKAKAYVGDLASADFKTREEAQKALLALAEYAVPACKVALTSEDKEVVTRAEVILKVLKERLPDEKFNPKLNDTIETAEFTFEGNIETVSMAVTTKYFGNSTVKFADLRTVKAHGAPGRDGTVKVDAAIYGKVNDGTWMDSGVDVRINRPLDITTTGSVDLWPQQPGGYIVNADGNPRQGTVNMVVGPNNAMASYAPGILLGRIGENGSVFIVGSSYKAPRSAIDGKLYLKIAPSPWGNSSTGTYTVTVK